MLYDDITFFLIAFHRIINVDTRLGIIPLFKQYPGIRIKKSSIIRFGFYRLITHFLGLVKITPFYRQIVSIIIQSTYIGRIVNQRGIVCIVCICHLLFGMINITHDRIEIRQDLFFTVRCSILQSFPADGKRLIMTLRLVIGNSQIKIELKRIGSCFDTRFADFYHLVKITLLYGYLQKHQTGSLISGIDLNNPFQHRYGSFLQIFSPKILRI